MQRAVTPEAGSRGRISRGPTASLLTQTLQFVYTELAAWRDDNSRPREEAEEALNAQLSKYLNVAARDKFPMVLFSHEERQTGTRRVDISALPHEAIFVGETYCSIYDPLLVFEGKRLPAPTSAREREYVSGGSAKTGGIQRFKLGLHGAKHSTAAIIGYIQADDPQTWFSRINSWIEAVAKNPSSDEQWAESEKLADYAIDSDRGVSQAWSTHCRVANPASTNITICHLWVVMEP